MTRRKAKKAFKKKWNAPGRIAVFKTVPKGMPPRMLDEFNTGAEKRILEAYVKALDELILYGSSGKTNFHDPEPAGILGRPLVARLVDNGSLPAAVGEIVFDASAGGAYPQGTQSPSPTEPIIPDPEG